jgi:hypothetical protein
MTSNPLLMTVLGAFIGWSLLSGGEAPRQGKEEAD